MCDSQIIFGRRSANQSLYLSDNRIPLKHTKDPIPLSSLLWIPPVHCHKPLNWILAHTLSVWDSIKYSACLISPPPPPTSNTAQLSLVHTWVEEPPKFCLQPGESVHSNIYGTLTRSLSRNVFNIYKFVTFWSL